jgi:hypothetical protein
MPPMGSVGCVGRRVHTQVSRSGIPAPGVVHRFFLFETMRALSNHSSFMRGSGFQVWRFLIGQVQPRREF